MRVPVPLSEAFGQPFEELVSRFALAQGWLPDAQALQSERFLSRSVVPHIRKLSGMFNREEAEQGAGLTPYWKESSNPAHLRLAYFLYFMPANLYRMASVWAELARLGFRWPAGRPLRALELGAGPASGACGIAAGEAHAALGLPAEGSWALIEQDKSMLQAGSAWAQEYFSNQGRPDWSVRPFHRKLALEEGLLPRAAPRFNLWITSYFLNELSGSPEETARALLQAWERHLDDEGLVILVEPALRLQSRKLLELRRALLSAKPRFPLQVLLPCLGHQNCGALADPEDWCHEEVSWWRPPYFRVLDKMAELDRKTLPFSYLVLARSARAREELLPELAAGLERKRYRLVSPAHSEGKEKEFFVCGQEGKRRARYRPGEDEELERGDVLSDADIRGDARASRVDRIGKLHR